MLIKNDPIPKPQWTPHIVASVKQVSGDFTF